MFRSPRNKESNPSVGRAPTPPTSIANAPFALATSLSIPAPKMAPSKASPSKPIPLPTIGRQGPSGSAKKHVVSKGKDRGNGNIMNFFKKSEREAGLFVEEKRGCSAFGDYENIYSMYEEIGPLCNVEESDERSRFNESGESLKRRKMSTEPDDKVNGNTSMQTSGPSWKPEPAMQKRNGPFLEDSDSEHEEKHPGAVLGVSDEVQICTRTTPPVDSQASETTGRLRLPDTGDEENNLSGPPALIKEETSYVHDTEDFQDFEGMNDFDEEPFEEGDEYMERKYMEEQALLEAQESSGHDVLPLETIGESRQDTSAADPDAPSCPICSIDLAGVDEQDAGIHVNNCLDGKPSPLPKNKETQSSLSTSKLNGPPTTSAEHFRKPNRAPKPGQTNPFTLGQPTTNGGSAFNKLMSGHAEDAAWAQAAASEHAARGKPSYQRTCPFYKILPGLFICVDAFRYGAVEGCQAYFLSHFHSDHYVGLTSHWSHGPIYCSKVTGNLVRQQLRVDAKYVVDLDFEIPTEIPNTRGVKVTMIHANHCPGSSLFLFEKIIGRKSNGEPKLQRILHCGDFRACRQHLEHPLLMPTVQDKITGTTREQKIDVCYLDTTYLNPRYAFPSQETVIKACAEMCVSLSKHSVDENDGWEEMKRQRAGEGMVKFIRKDSNPEIKEEPPDDDAADIKLLKNPHASQQILANSAMPSAQQGRGRLLVIVGTYSIGKERICLGIAKALKSKIYAPLSKQRIVAALEDPELNERMTNDPREAQVHMTPLFEIRAETLDDYLKDHFPHFTRAVGFRPSGWNYRPPTSRFTESPSVQTVLHSDNWKSNYSMKDLVPQRGSSSRSSCFGVPYSEHSSFRELTMFCCALRIEKVIPTVNVGNAKSRERMKAWVERWTAERRKNGLYQLPDDGSW